MSTAKGLRPISYVIERSARRTIGIYVERDGQVRVRAPEKATDERIATVVNSKLPWVYRTLARWSTVSSGHTRKEFVSGETIYFLGRPHRLDFREDTSKPLELAGDIFVVRRDCQSETETLLKTFYRDEGLRRIPAMVEEHARTMGLTPARVRVLDLGHRWGSCSESGTLNFHWKALGVPLEVLHYLVVHELAHLERRDHSARFWSIVEAEMPNWKDHARWLTACGAQMAL